MSARRREGTAPIAVIDVGSNSLRMMVARCRAHGYLEVIAEPRATLRLARAVDADGGFSPATMTRTLAVIEDFLALAERDRVGQISAVGTSALRDAENAAELGREIHARWGIELKVLDAASEGRLAAQGAAYGLPVESGFVADLGGGSLQIVRVEQREVADTWSFPLGTLRLTDRFFAADPPTPEELEALRLHVRAEFVSAGIPRLAAGEVLVGTGGTVRNLAAVSRRGRRYPISGVHGYVLTSRRLRRVRDRLAALSAEQRREVQGLNRDRADIIVAGASGVLAIIEHLRAPSLLVSGQGLREGVARGDVTLPTAAAARSASVNALARRFASWDEARAHRRVETAGALAALLDPDADEHLLETLRYAALLLDIGSAIDVYRHQRATAHIVLRADLTGFGHVDVARLAAVIRVANRPDTEARSFRPLLGPEDDDALQRAGALLALADELERRLPLADPPHAHLALADGALHVSLPDRPGWHADVLGARIERVFGQRLLIEGRAG